MQAPLSRTASGQEQRTGPIHGLPSSMLAIPLAGDTTLEYSRLEYSRLDRVAPGPGRRMRAWSSSASSFSSSTNSSATDSFLTDLASPAPPVAEGVGLAHDAGNLLGALRLYCDLLARPGVLREEHHHYAEELQLLSKRSGTLIDRLLNPATTRGEGRSGAAPAFAVGSGQRAAHGRVAAATGTVPRVAGREMAVRERSAPEVIVPEVIEQCRGLLNVIARRAVAVAYEGGAGMPVPVGREVVERILVNLTKNAAEASPAGGAITLRVSCLREREAGGRKGVRAGAVELGPRRIVLSVEDQGRGMSVAAVKVLLEGAPGAGSSIPIPIPGSMPTSAAAERPRGLGLRVVRELVRDSGGELRLKSRSGCGTTVEIAWAVVAGPPDAPSRNGSDRVAALEKAREVLEASETLEAAEGNKGGVSC